MQALRGKKLAFVATGCGDNAFIDNAMLESEVDATFFAARAVRFAVFSSIFSAMCFSSGQHRVSTPNSAP